MAAVERGGQVRARERERLAGRRVLIGLSGRGDKDLASVLPRLGHGGEA